MSPVLKSDRLKPDSNYQIFKLYITMINFYLQPVFVSIFYLFSVNYLFGQTETKPENVIKEYTNIGEALTSPEKVLRLDLSNTQAKLIPDTLWLKFKNLEYLSLKNDHLIEIPEGIGFLQNLKVLDLSGNDFKVLPKSFANLYNLNEIYLNDEKYMDVDKSINVIRNLPNLKILHLENDNLKRLPESIIQITTLEALYINNNKFKEFPRELKELKNLKFVDLHDNKFNIKGMDSQSFGYKMRF